MKIKEFLKPDKKKLIVFVIIALLAMTVGRMYMSSIGPIPTVGTFYNPIFWLPLLIIYGRVSIFGDGLNPFGLSYQTHPSLSLFQIHPLFTLGTIISIPYWYLLSCALVLIYKRLRSGNEKI